MECIQHEPTTIESRPYWHSLILFPITLGAGTKVTQLPPPTKKRQHLSIATLLQLPINFAGTGFPTAHTERASLPGGKEPSKEQIREDLKILAAAKWQMIRTYGTEPFAKKVCEVIKEDKLNIKVMLGAWLATEKDNPDTKSSNQSQVKRAIELANQYPNVVAAVSVANESQVFWSFHKVEQSTLIKYIRQVRSSIKQPVTVADDFKYWTTRESKKVANEIDFIVTHIYAMWLGETLPNATSFTEKTYDQVKKTHPKKLIVIGEAGWATKKASHGDQATRIKGKPGESEQKQFFDDYTAWLKENKIPYFYFEAFDEPWKGGDDPSEVEKHWGLFNEDRTPKPAAMKK